MDKAKPRLTPAALAALARGDFANAMVAATPGGIEAQEAAGQKELCASTRLPKTSGYQTMNRSIYEAMGIVFGDDADDLFVNVTLPAGWHLEPTDRSMWNNLVDDKGRKRARIFYKAAFYDRKADIHVVRRFSYGSRPVGGWDSDPLTGQVYEGYVSDENSPSDPFTTSPTGPEPQFDRNNRDLWRAWAEKKEALEQEACRWLTEQYPDWQNPLAYWD